MLTKIANQIIEIKGIKQETMYFKMDIYSYTAC